MIYAAVIVLLSGAAYGQTPEFVYPPEPSIQECTYVEFCDSLNVVDVRYRIGRKRFSSLVSMVEDLCADFHFQIGQRKPDAPHIVTVGLMYTLHVTKHDVDEVADLIVQDSIRHHQPLGFDRVNGKRTICRP